LLHTRYRALFACGNPHWRKCNICKRYDDPVNLSITTSRKPYIAQHYQHKSCRNTYLKERRKKLKLSLSSLNLVAENAK
jgi:transposase-like protein